MILATAAKRLVAVFLLDLFVFEDTNKMTCRNRVVTKCEKIVKNNRSCLHKTKISL